MRLMLHDDGRWQMNEAMMHERIYAHQKCGIERSHRDTRSGSPDVARCSALTKVNGQADHDITEHEKGNHCAHRRHVMANEIEQVDQAEILHGGMRETA